MICPNCGEDNLPGVEVCRSCQQDLTQLDRPTAQSAVERSLMEDPVSVITLCPTVMVGLTTTLREAIHTMRDPGVGAVLVVDETGQPVGIFSERDLLTKVADTYTDYAELPVSRFMTPDPVTVTLRDSLASALQKMDVGGYRHLPVIEDGKPIGMLSVRDMLRHIRRLCRDG